VQSKEKKGSKKSRGVIKTRAKMFLFCRGGGQKGRWDRKDARHQKKGVLKGERNAHPSETRQQHPTGEGGGGSRRKKNSEELDRKRGIYKKSIWTSDYSTGKTKPKPPKDREKGVRKKRRGKGGDPDILYDFRETPPTEREKEKKKKRVGGGNGQRKQ